MVGATQGLTIVICLVMFVIQTWILFGHKNKLGAEKTDVSHDPVFSRINLFLAFSAFLFAYLVGMLRRILIELDIWHTFPFSEILNLGSLSANTTTLWLGFGIFIVGLVIRVWAIRILGRFFTFEIGIRKNHKIIKEGPYQYIRHPSYTGFLIMIIGLGIAYASWLLLFLLFSGSMIFLAHRIHEEEKMLVSNFGKKYRDYQKQSKRLIPFVY